MSPSQRESTLCWWGGKTYFCYWKLFSLHKISYHLLLQKQFCRENKKSKEEKKCFSWIFNTSISRRARNNVKIWICNQKYLKPECWARRCKGSVCLIGNRPLQKDQKVWSSLLYFVSFINFSTFYKSFNPYTFLAFLKLTRTTLHC